MQIGSGNNRLPGCAPTSDAPASDAAAPDTQAPVAPPVPIAPMSAEVGASRSAGGKKAVLLVVFLLLLAGAAVGAYYRYGQDLKDSDFIPSAVQSVTQFFARMVAYIPGMGASVTNGAATVTPAEPPRAVSDYSPIVPINETRRVKGLARFRVADNDATNGAVAAAPVVAASTVSVADASEKPKPAKPAAKSASAKPEGKAFVWPVIKVSASMAGTKSKSFARINGSLVTVGDVVSGATVVEISAQCVTLACNGEQREFYVGSGK